MRRKKRSAAYPNQLFEIGSISKSFLAICLLQLLDEGKLDLQRPIAEYTQAVCGFRYLASNATPFFQTANVIAAIFRARVRRAISMLIPFATRPS